MHTSHIENVERLEGCHLIKNFHYLDIRGSFRKILPFLEESKPVEFTINQVNLSSNSLAGTIRGLHYQVDPFLETKLISCIQGSVLDVLLDMRPNSKTFGKLAYYRLSPSEGSLLVPPSVAHGFQSLEDNTLLLYLHSNEYNPRYSRGVNPLDPHLGIRWPLPISSVSDSDINLPLFSVAKN